jgi:hypothetical protein
VEGLDTVRRLDGKAVQLTPERYARAARLVPEMRAGFIVGTRHPDDLPAAQRPTSLTVQLRNKPPKIDGRVDDWDMGKAAEIKVDPKRGARVALGRDDRQLYLAYEVKDPNPWQNAAESFDSMFLSGDCVDLMLRTDPAAKGGTAVRGDLRLLFGPLGDETVAVLYDAVVPGAADPVTFASPGNKTEFDVVRRLDNAAVAVRRTDDGYVLEATVPLADLHLQPEAAKTLRGDVGVLFSDNVGQNTAVRAYYFNTGNATIVSDVGQEARLLPRAWGELAFE